MTFLPIRLESVNEDEALMNPVGSRSPWPADHRRFIRRRNGAQGSPNVAVEEPELPATAVLVPEERLIACVAPPLPGCTFILSR